tara:strand:- start:2140 stop:2496 length:357 start_codon:yes stop_codon:yes gene_type:complete
MPLSTSLRKASKKAIAGLGGNVTIRRVTTGAYNTTTGAVGETTSDTTVKGLVQDVNAREVNELIQADDRKLTVAAAALTYTPTTADRVVIGSVVHQIISIKTEEQANTAITYELVLRA